jgi:hypothetical protein
MRSHGVRFEDRRAIVHEKMQAARRLWLDEVAEYHGEHVHLEPSNMWPKPVQQPPPILLGGQGGPKLLRAAAELSDGLMSTGASVTSTMTGLRDELARIGRPEREVPVTCFGYRPDPGLIDHLVELGVHRTVLEVPVARADEVLPVLDEWVALVERAHDG